MGTPRKVIASGTPYEQGCAQGEAFKELIKFNIDVVQADMAKKNLNHDLYRDLTKRGGIYLEKYQPRQWEEIKGIAAGSGLPFDEIVQINVPTYFMKPTLEIQTECSMLLARGNATADGLTYLIKNRDMTAHVQQVTVQYKYPDGSSIAEVGGAGIITYPALGLNDAGLMATSTGFWSKKVKVDIDDIDCCNLFVNLHHVLENCKTVDDVFKFLDTYPRMNGLNMIVADEKCAALIETTRDGYLTQWADDNGGILFQTNHYNMPEHVHLNKDYDEYPSTFLRYDRIKELLAETQHKLRLQDMLRIMSDHKNSPINAICRHGIPAVPNETVSCTACCLEDRELFNTPGNPCEHIVTVSI